MHPNVSAVVLAAGDGGDMRSARPKPLHLLCGRPMVVYVLDALRDVTVDRAVVVVGAGAEQLTKKLQAAGADVPIDLVEQRVPRGTGDAVSVALTAFPDDDVDDSDIVVLPADTPLLRSETVRTLLQEHRLSEAACTVLTAVVGDPTGYGRVVRGRDERVARIIEEADAAPSERAITEVNTSIYCFRRSILAPALRRLSPENGKGEYYLTDVVEVLHDAGYKVLSVTASDPAETQGVNDRVQLATAEAELRRRTNDAWLRLGVTMLDPARTYIDATVRLSADVTLFPGTILQGHTVVGEGAEIGPDTHLADCVIGPGAKVAHTVGEQADVGRDAVVGPYAVLEPGSAIGQGTRTGPFYTARGDDGTDRRGTRAWS
jgi:bifunctional UDP-N-acetylglucosamine pyrophosphorylase/glucosamine-1-phosphate N-acetyltransferase